MKRFTPCTVTITNLETRLRVGIWDHEREFQPIRINLSLHAIDAARLSMEPHPLTPALSQRERVRNGRDEIETSSCRINNGCTDPQMTEDLFDCQSIRKWITEEWPKQSHTPLLETKLRELMEFVFQFDARIEWLDAAMSKPEACPEARGVGIRMAISRCDYAAWF